MELKTGWSLTKYNIDSRYMVMGSGVFIHGNKIELATNNKTGTWLNILYDGTYVSSIWIDTTDKIKEIKKFIKEEK